MAGSLLKARPVTILLLLLHRFDEQLLFGQEQYILFHKSHRVIQGMNEWVCIQQQQRSRRRLERGQLPAFYCS